MSEKAGLINVCPWHPARCLLEGLNLPASSVSLPTEIHGVTLCHNLPPPLQHLSRDAKKRKKGIGRLRWVHWIFGGLLSWIHRWFSSTWETSRIKPRRNFLFSKKSIVQNRTSAPDTFWFLFWVMAGSRKKQIPKREIVL